MQAVSGYSVFPLSYSYGDTMAGRACASVGQLFFKGNPSGNAILIGIDRVIIPFHLIDGKCPDELSLSFVTYVSYPPYPVIRFLVVDRERDFAILQLDQNVMGAHAGENSEIAKVHYSNEHGPFFMVSYREGLPAAQYIADGSRCFQGNYCSSAQTTEGDSGAGYFNEKGALFAIHLSRSSGLCHNVPTGLRRALLISELAKNPKARTLLLRPTLDPLPKLTEPSFCLAPSLFRDRCFIDEGKPACSGASSDHSLQYAEWIPTFCRGKGPRGLTVFKPGTPNSKVTYKFDLNPHHFKEYKGSKKCSLYQTAADALAPLAKVQYPSSFSFWAYRSHQIKALLA